MPRMILSLHGVDVREVTIAQGRSTVGRKLSNQIVIDHPTVSGRHAALHCTVNVVMLEDLGSTNGSHVNGHAIRMQVLRDADVVQLGQYTLRYLADAVTVPPVSHPAGSHIRVLSGNGAGETVSLQKVVNTVGRPGVAVAAVTRRLERYVVTRIDAGTVLNGELLGADTVPLHDGDVLELAGLQLQFVG